MYDLTLEKGDTFDIKVSLQEGCDSISAIIIDSVGHKVIDGLNLKVQYFSYIAYFNNDHHELHSDSIIERIGRIQEFIYNPICGRDVVPWETLLLRCYQDSDISFKADWWTNYAPNAPCDTLIDGHTGIAQY